MRGRGGPRFNFPNWNYGYTPGPPAQANGTRPPTRGGTGRGGGQGRNNTTVQTASNIQTATSAIPQPGFKEEKNESLKPPLPPVAAQNIPSEDNTHVTREEVKVVERPLKEILQGKNPIMYCNDQSKVRNLRMEWEQISETGPPHDKIFTWELKMGEMLTMGEGSGKKLAKNKAAEEMVKKLDQLPKIAQKRTFNQAARGGRGRGRGGGFANVPVTPEFYGNQFPKKPKIAPTELSMTALLSQEAANNPPFPTVIPPTENANKPLKDPQNNPITKLYEHSKKQKLPEPIFDLVHQEVLETKTTTQGFNYKKTKFVMQCEILGKKFLGESMNKKTAKFNAAEKAWASISGV